MFLSALRTEAEEEGHFKESQAETVIFCLSRLEFLAVDQAWEQGPALRAFDLLVMVLFLLLFMFFRRSAKVCCVPKWQLILQKSSSSKAVCCSIILAACFEVWGYLFRVPALSIFFLAPLNIY